MADGISDDGATYAVAAVGAVEAWAREISNGASPRGRRRSAKFDDRWYVLALVFTLYAADAPDEDAAHGAALAAMTADLLDMARRLGWQPKRKPVSARRRTIVYRRDGYACVECGDDDVTQLTLDHRVPVLLGGTNSVDNLRTLCRSCNCRKGAAVE